MYPFHLQPQLRLATSRGLTTMLSASLLALALGSINTLHAQTFRSDSDESAATALAAASASASSEPVTSDAGFSSSLSTGSSSSSAAVPSVAGQQGYPSYGRRDNHWSRLAFEIGGGATAPTEDSSPYITWGGNVTGGVGYHFNTHFAVLGEFQYIDSKLPGRIISEAGAQGGNAHIYSATLAPVIDFFPKDRNDIYLIGGGGFYRKVTSFTDPTAVQYCDYYYCGIATVNQVVGHFSSNQGGWNGGLGLSRRLGFGQAKLFAEARYLYVDTPAVHSQPNGLGTTTVAAETRLIPVTLGLRW